MNWIAVTSPVGALTITAADDEITSIAWHHKGSGDRPTTLLRQAAAQLTAYFAKELRRFDLPIAPSGTAFQQRLWQAMLEIPYGAVQSYGALAKELGSGARAVGMGCGANPIPLIVPCHRVVAASGLGGFSGGRGPATKRQLLTLEGASLPD